MKIKSINIHVSPFETHFRWYLCRHARCFPFDILQFTFCSLSSDAWWIKSKFNLKIDFHSAKFSHKHTYTHKMFPEWVTYCPFSFFFFVCIFFFAFYCSMNQINFSIGCIFFFGCRSHRSKSGYFQHSIY